MVQKKSKNKLGLILGILFAIIHAIWALTVAIIPSGLQKGLDWIFNIHFIKPIWVITQFNFLDALLLIIVTFIIGYIIGWILAFVWNLIIRK